MVAPAKPREPFATFDWVGAGVVCAAVAALMLLPLEVFRGMFQDLGPSDLPLLTTIALYPGFSVFVSLPAVAALIVAIRLRRPLKQRRIWLGVAFVVCCLGFALCFFAMYLPIFTLAGKIKAG